MEQNSKPSLLLNRISKGELRCPGFSLPHSHPPWPGQGTGTRTAINEDAAQESERRLVDSYLRLGEISHLALQRDTITKHY